MKKFYILFIVLMFSSLLCNAETFDTYNTNLYLYMSGLKVATQPVIMDNYLVLSAQGAYRHVGAAFSHEDWKSIHGFKKNQYNVFVLAIPIPYSTSKAIFYRLILDGLWAKDPANPISERDNVSGASLSVVQFPERSNKVLGVWNPAGNGMATFYFEAQPGLHITVAGTFNNWDPFIHELEEKSPGKYELNLQLNVGTYYYCFVYKGEFIPDPLNKNMYYNKSGQSVSAIHITNP